MNKGKMVILFCALALLISIRGPSACAVERDYLAKIINIEQPAEIIRADSHVPVTARVGFTLRAQDTLVTRDNGKCAIAFPRGSQIIVRATETDSSLLLQKNGRISLMGGQLWAQLRGEDRITIDTPPLTGKVSASSQVAEIVLTVAEEKASPDHGKSRLKYTEATVISGEATLINSIGSIRIPAMNTGRITFFSSPIQTGELTETDLGAIKTWVNFNNKSIVIFMREKQLGTVTSHETIQKEMESLLQDGHYRVLTEQSILKFNDQEIQTLAKKAYEGDRAAARKLAREVGVDLFLTGSVSTKVLGEAYSGLISCSSSGELQIYSSERDEILVSKVSHATDIKRSVKDASSGAIEKVMKELSAMLVPDLNQSLADLIVPIEQPSQIEVTIQNFPLPEKGRILEKLKKLNGTVKVDILPTARGSIHFQVQTTASSRTILNNLLQDKKLELKMLELESDRIILKVTK